MTEQPRVSTDLASEPRGFNRAGAGKGKQPTRRGANADTAPSIWTRTLCTVPSSALGFRHDYTHGRRYALPHMSSTEGKLSYHTAAENSEHVTAPSLGVAIAPSRTIRACGTTPFRPRPRVPTRSDPTVCWSLVCPAVGERWAERARRRSDDSADLLRSDAVDPNFPASTRRAHVASGSHWCVVGQNTKQLEHLQNDQEGLLRSRPRTRIAMVRFCRATLTVPR